MKYEIGNYSCIIINNATERKYTQRGVKDLFDIVENEPETLHGAIVIDRAVGKAAATLMILGGANEVHTLRISSAALRMLRANGIAVNYDEEVPVILNRTQSGSCPMEALCRDSDDPQALLPIIRQFVNEHNK